MSEEKDKIVPAASDATGAPVAEKKPKAPKAKAPAAAKDAADVTLDLARKQYQSGYANYLSLLNVEQAYQQAVINLVQAQANRYADTAALFQALGGGWWNRADLPKR